MEDGRFDCVRNEGAAACGFSGVEAVAEVELPRPVDFAESFQKGSLRRLLVVDGVQDPGNLVSAHSPGQSINARPPRAPSLPLGSP